MMAATVCLDTSSEAAAESQELVFWYPLVRAILGARPLWLSCKAFPSKEQTRLAWIPPNAAMRVPSNENGQKARPRDRLVPQEHAPGRRHLCIREAEERGWDSEVQQELN